jgi:hypothetical protein
VSNGWSNGHQNPQVTLGSYAVGFADIGNEHVTRLRGKCRPVFRQKLSGSFKNGDAQLALNFMGMDGKLLSRLSISPRVLIITSSAGIFFFARAIAFLTISAFYPPDNNPAERGIKHPGHSVGPVLALIVQYH